MNDHKSDLELLRKVCDILDPNEDDSNIELIDALFDRFDQAIVDVEIAQAQANAYKVELKETQAVLDAAQTTISEAYDLLRQHLGNWDGISPFLWPDHLTGLAPIIELLEE